MSDPGWFEKGGTERRHHPSRADDVAIQEHRIIDGHRLHILQDFDGEWVVWLNTEVTDFDGLVIGTGRTRDEAVAAAVKTAEAIEANLQGPPGRMRTTDD